MIAGDEGIMSEQNATSNKKRLFECLTSRSLSLSLIILCHANTGKKKITEDTKSA